MNKLAVVVIGAAFTAIILVSLLGYMGRGGVQAGSSFGRPPPMTVVYEMDGPAVSVGDRSTEPFKEVHRLEYQSETEWVDTVIEAPTVDLGLVWRRE